MNQKDKPKGVMGKNYSLARQKKYSLIYRYKSRAYETVKEFQKYSFCKEPPKILDFGTAEGFTLTETHTLLNAAYSLGVEYSKDLVDSAVKLPRNCSIIQGDATKSIEEVENEYFDLVTALAVLEHLDEPIKLFENAYKNLKKNALLIATCPSPFWDNISGKLKLHEDDFHAFDFTKNVFEKLAKETGFEVVEYRRFMSAPIGFAPYLKIQVSPSFSHIIDLFVRKLKIFNFIFVNQIFVARKK